MQSSQSQRNSPASVASVASSAVLLGSRAGKPKCWHGAACRKLGDQAHCDRYDHDLKPCKFGARCKRRGRGCKYLHPGQEGIPDQQSLLVCQEVEEGNDSNNNVKGAASPLWPIPFILTLIFIGAVGLFMLPLVGFCNDEMHVIMFFAGCALVAPFLILQAILCSSPSSLLKCFVAGDYAERATFRTLGCMWFPETLQPLTYTAGDLKGMNIEQYATWETNNAGQQYENATGGNRDGGQVVKVTGGFSFDFPAEFCGESRSISPSGVIEGLHEVVKFDGSYIIFRDGAFSKAGWWRLDCITKLLLALLVLGLECMFVSMVMPPGVDFLDGGAFAKTLPLNLVFVVDGSGSIEPDMWTAQQVAGTKFIRAFQQAVPNDLRMGIVQFSKDSQVEEHLTSDIQAVVNGFENLHQMQATTYFDKAIRTCRSELDTFQDKSFDVCILISDGIDMSGLSAQELQGTMADGDAIFGIFVGTSAEYIEKLKEITMCGMAQPKKGPCEFFASAEDYTALSQKAEDVASSIKDGLDLASCLMVSSLIGLPIMFAMLAPRILWYATCCTATVVRRRMDDNNNVTNNADGANNAGGRSNSYGRSNSNNGHSSKH